MSGTVKDSDNITITAPTTEWTTTMTLGTEYRIYAENLLNSPEFCMRTSTGKTVQLYTKNQMLDMFKFGYTISQQPYMFLQEMTLNSTAVFPAELWGPVRSAASKLKKQHGYVYRIERIKVNKKPVGVKVKRVV